MGNASIISTATSSTPPKEGAFAQRIDTARKTGRLRIVAAKEFAKLDTFPVNIKALDASECALDVVPEAIGRFTKLTTLKLNGNPNLAELPIEGLTALEALKTLDLSHTAVHHIELFPQTRLTHLNLACCHFKGVLGHPVLALPRSLIELDLSGNKGVTALGVSFGFEALPLLESLDLSDTCIAELPDAMAELSRLSCLKLEHTAVAFIPEGLFTRTPLSRLELKGSRVTKEAFLEMKGAQAFLQRRQDRLSRDLAGGMANVDTSLCGLD